MKPFSALSAAPSNPLNPPKSINEVTSLPTDLDGPIHIRWFLTPFSPDEPKYARIYSNALYRCPEFARAFDLTIDARAPVLEGASDTLSEDEDFRWRHVRTDRAEHVRILSMAALKDKNISHLLTYASPAATYVFVAPSFCSLEDDDLAALQRSEAKILTPSPAAKNCVVAAGVDARRVVVAPLPLPPAPLVPASAKRSEANPLYAFVGDDTDADGLDLFLESVCVTNASAIAFVAAQNATLRAPPFNCSARVEVKRLSADPPLSELLAVFESLPANSIFVQPHRTDSLALRVALALRAGLSIVATNFDAPTAFRADPRVTLLPFTLTNHLTNSSTKATPGRAPRRPAVAASPNFAALVRFLRAAASKTPPPPLNESCDSSPWRSNCVARILSAEFESEFSRIRKGENPKGRASCAGALPPARVTAAQDIAAEILRRDAQAAEVCLLGGSLLKGRDLVAYVRQTPEGRWNVARRVRAAFKFELAREPTATELEARVREVLVGGGGVNGYDALVASLRATSEFVAAVVPSAEAWRVSELRSILRTRVCFSLRHGGAVEFSSHTLWTSVEDIFRTVLRRAPSLPELWWACDRTGRSGAEASLRFLLATPDGRAAMRTLARHLSSRAGPPPPPARVEKFAQALVGGSIRIADAEEAARAQFGGGGECSAMTGTRGGGGWCDLSNLKKAFVIFQVRTWT
jgi:hypothetical protein